YDDWKVALKAFETHLSAELEASVAGFFTIAFEEIGRHGTGMVLWRVLIRNAGKTTTTAQSLLPLLLQSIVFRQAELEGPIKDFLRAGYARLTPAERSRLDEAIVSIERDAPDDMRSYRRKLIEAYAKAVPVGISTVLDRYGPEAAEDGDSLDDCEAAFVDEDEFDDPGSADVPVALPPGDDAYPQSRDTAAENAGPASNIRALFKTIGEPTVASPSVLTQLLKLVREGLVSNALSNDDLREVTPALLAAAAFDPSLTVSDDGIAHDYAAGELSRHAASTIPWVYQQQSDPRLADAIIKLAAHPDVYVRSAILQHVMLLGPAHGETRWKIVEHAINDPSPGVSFMAGDVLFRHLATIDGPRAKRGWFAVYDRFAANVLHDVTIELSRGLITLTVAGDSDAADRLDRTLSDPWQNPELAKLVVFALATSLAPCSETTNAVELQSRVLGFIKRLHSQLDDALAAHGYDYSNYPAGEADRTKLSVDLLMELAHRLQIHMDIASPSGDIANLDEARTHYAALLPLFEALATVPIAHVGYYLVQALATVIELNPRGALLLATQAILTAAKAGLASDHFGQEKARDFLLRYVRDYRELLVNDQEAFSVAMNVVDAFADVGWPEWIDIAIALDALYHEQ
ncbi:MAG: hypothetical protein M3N13_08700, partial [Candidatus Eremiobacteraeota bacterium]|nr:hypothetical protein [Candidatus Eremiobacteraeota bacterium]